MKRLLIVVATLSLVGCGAMQQTCKSPDAQGVVGALRSEDQFKSMLTMVAERTTTFAIASRLDGDRAEEKLSAAVEAATAGHKATWEQNLVDGWAKLSASELDQVCTALAKRDQSTFMRFAEQVGPQVQARNELLLKQAGTEVLRSLELGGK